MTASPSAAPYGTPVDVTAAVSPVGTPASNGSGGVVLPTGTVQFFDGTTALTTAPTPVTAQAGYTTMPFSKVFGTLDPVFTGVDGQFAADLNGDGVQDLVVYMGGSVGTQTESYLEVQTFLSKAGGGFTTVAAQKLALPVQPIEGINVFTPVLADLNGDGKADLLIGPAVAYGNGDGTFQQPVTLPFLAAGFVSTYAADVTGDGKPDIVATDLVPNLTSTATIPLQVTVFVNQGGGAFQSSGTFTIATGQCPCAGQPDLQLAFADLNGDGLLDILAQYFYAPTDNTNPQSFTSLLNSGNGNFATGVPVAFTPQDISDDDVGQPLAMQVADFNQDGKADLVVVYPSNDLLSGDTTTIVFLPGNNDGTFGPQVNSTASYPMPSQQGPFPIAPAGNAVVTDTNLDGFPDLVFGTAAVAAGDGTGKFSAGAEVGSQSNGFAASVGLLQLTGSALPSLVFAGTSSNSGSDGVTANSYVATQTEASTATISPTLGAGAHSITAKYSGDSNYAASTSAATAVNIGLVATTTTVTSTANPAYRGETATITVSVRSSSGGIPTGTVSFTCDTAPMSGLTCPGPLPLDAQGNASFQASNTGSLDGSLVMTVTYFGDANHASSTVQYTQGFLDPVNIASSASGAGTITVKSGQSASTQLGVSGSAGFTGAADLGCSGLPANASCVINPAITSLTGTAQIVTLTVSTRGSTSAALRPLFGQGLQTLVCGFFAGSLLLLFPRRRWTHWIGIAIIGLGLLPLGCGGNHSSSNGGSSSNVAPGTYPFTISGNGGGQASGAQSELVVQ